MKKFFYYALGVYLAIVPFAFLFMAMLYLSYAMSDPYEWAAVCVVMYGLYFIYLVWMFED